MTPISEKEAWMRYAGLAGETGRAQYLAGQRGHCIGKFNYEHDMHGCNAKATCISCRADVIVNTFHNGNLLGLALKAFCEECREEGTPAYLLANGANAVLCSVI